jgi:KDO2-lipid IV(A) lauroyltransferase
VRELQYRTVLLLRRTRAALVKAAEFILKPIVHLAWRGMRALDPDRSADFAGAFARRIGPWLPTSRIGRENLRHAFPKKSAAEIEATLAGVWENLGRVAGEFAHLDRVYDWHPLWPGLGRIESRDVERYITMRDDGKPSLVFSAHLANWELPAVAAAAHGLDAVSVFRMPGMRVFGDLIHEVRRETMGRLLQTDRMAALAMAAEIERGAHLGMLVDQFWTGGSVVTFFGRPCPANPTIARLARHFECEVRGVRVVRLPNRRFRLEATEPLELPRDAAGKVDVDATMQMITSIIEGWIREYPEQWLWLHRRWRDYF